ncbi:AN1-type Zinc finger protein [Natrialba magadii ATCC 43099]|uniref:AN1-type Zinc finger protein n=1 Tax=Natrialba magadii (strain ATCC 43099 / DSM 3394 / CCM 3739 / CIP 104546 / IAM 13178 / JCM 8861 / NBRC 102185 / NCIMB 2190 / MS3) TaxID=547559 RepID=L9V4X8_NATMM|nr:AN1-type Zinc finger protein [Natrialba magadii ATCC 43099]
MPENHQCPHLDQVQTLGPEFRRGAAVIDGDTDDSDSNLSRVVIGAGVVFIAIMLVAMVLLL